MHKLLALVTFVVFAGCGQQLDAVLDEGGSPATAAESVAENPPNFLLILADDLGYTDLGIFGSEIRTPSIDRLARNGLILTNFYTSPICAPTRTELLSGTDHHLAGQGMMQVNVEGDRGYEGRLSNRVVSLATRLRDAGYFTAMAGKWHLGARDGEGPEVRGFDRSFVMLDGAASHYADRVGIPPGKLAPYREDGKPVESLPDNFYTTDGYTEKIISYLDENAATGKPFLAYLAYTAPHWPVQVPEDELPLYRGQYSDGYEVLRKQRFAAWKEAGWGKHRDELPHLPRDYVPWNSLDDGEKAISSRIMETYAAMVERMDRRIGDVIDYLDASGQLGNTIILFLSDNGAEATAGYAGFKGNYDNSLDNIGKIGSFAYLGPGWAEAGSAPFYQNKSFAAEGGIRVPAIISGSGLGVPEGREDALLMVYDVAPTLLELAGIDASAYEHNDDIVPISGRSFASLLRGETFDNRRGEDVAVGREHAGNASIRRGPWKLTWIGEDDFYLGDSSFDGGANPMSGVPMPRERFDRGVPAGTPIGPGGPWQLFNLEEDVAERNDVAAQYPEVYASMLTEWDRYVQTHGILVKSGQTAPHAQNK